MIQFSVSFFYFTIEVAIANQAAIVFFIFFAI